MRNDEFHVNGVRIHKEIEMRVQAVTVRKNRVDPNNRLEHTTCEVTVKPDIGFREDNEERIHAATNEALRFADQKVDHFLDSHLDDDEGEEEMTWAISASDEEIKAIAMAINRDINRGSLLAVHLQNRIKDAIIKHLHECRE